MFTTNPGDTITDLLAVFEDDGITKHSGLLQGDFAITVWQDGTVASLPVTVTEIGSSGEYKVVYAPPASGFWNVELFCAFSEEYFLSSASVGLSADLTGVKGDLALIQGLLQLNGMLDQQTFDANNQLTGGRLRIFDNPSHIPVVPGGSEVTGLKYQFAVSAAYDGPNRPNLFTFRRIS